MIMISSSLEDSLVSFYIFANMLVHLGSVLVCGSMLITIYHIWYFLCLLDSISLYFELPLSLVLAISRFAFL